MNKTVLLLITSAAMLAACADLNMRPPGQIKSCPGSNGKDIRIRYGDGYIEVDWKQTVKQDEKIVFDLHPQNNPPSGINYKDMTISIIGKTTDDSWLDRYMSYSGPGDHKVICVDGQSTGTYEYSVFVPGLGYVDPYVQVIP